MNVIFSMIFILSTILMLHTDPQSFLPAVLSGASSAATLCLSLLATYAFWLGVMRLWEDSGITRMISKLLKPIVGRLFKLQNEESKRAVAMNVAANLLGLGGAATPFGIKAAKLLEEEENERYSSSMLFALNATSLQLIPTSIVAMRAALGCPSPASVILPILLSSTCSAVCSILLVRLFIRPKTVPKKGSEKRGIGVRQTVGDKFFRRQPNARKAGRREAGRI